MEASQSVPGRLRVRTGSSRQVDPQAAVRELAAAIGQRDMGLVIVFVSSAYDQEPLARALQSHFGDAIVIGCTTAGEIGPAGYLDHSLSGVSFHREDLAFEAAVFEGLSRFEFRDGQRFAHGLKEALRRRVPELMPERTFAFMLIDGLCRREERVTRAFYDGLEDVALVGGSAGDDLAFRETRVLAGGRFVSDAALLIVATTPFPFAVFKTQHFVGTEERLVVTGAIPEKRTVTEINGCPAAYEYANAVGIEIDRLDPLIFAAHPMVVRIGDAEFVRSIQTLNTDGSLTFYCAIDEGIVFRVARSVDMVENLAAALDDVAARVGKPSLVLGCDCILRRLEAKQRETGERIDALLRRSNVVGFSTYGEQFCGVHINQTFTGVAFGDGERE